MPRRVKRAATPLGPRASRRRQSGRPNTRPAAEVVERDPTTGLPAEARVVQPFEAQKTYLCPGCNQVVHSGTRHVVVVPVGAADLRRHWHAGCFEARHRRGPTGRR